MKLRMRLTEQQMRTLLLRECNAVGGMEEWASTHDISRSYVRGVLNGQFPVAKKIYEALGCKKIVLFECAHGVSQLSGE